MLRINLTNWCHFIQKIAYWIAKHILIVAKNQASAINKQLGNLITSWNSYRSSSFANRTDSQPFWQNIHWDNNRHSVYWNGNESMFNRHVPWPGIEKIGRIFIDFDNDEETNCGADKNSESFRDYGRGNAINIFLRGLSSIRNWKFDEANSSKSFCRKE